MILGHGGMGDMYKYPNNSLEAIIPVIGIGADGSELDVQLSKDSILVLYHDEKLDSRTNYTGFVHDYTWYELQNCLYSTMMGEVHIISIDELFNSLSGLNDLYFSFDCKLQNNLYYDQIYRECFLRAIKKTSVKYNIEDNIFIEGDLNFLKTAKELGLRCKGVLIGSNVDMAVENEIFAIGTTLNTPAEEISYAHEKGIHVMMWGAKTDMGNKQAIRLNPDFLQTDKPIPILMLFKRFNYNYRIP
ncbi:MAG: glycerophosphodiester phosphodiesterase family protein [Bacteroidota bacterium]